MVGTANNYPGSPNINLNLFTVQTNTGHTDKGIECYGIDEQYLGSLGIRVLAIAPSLFATGLTQGIPDEFAAALKRRAEQHAPC